MLTIEQEKFNIDIIKRKLDILTLPAVCWGEETPWPNIFYQKTIKEIFEYIERNPPFAMENIEKIYDYNYDRWNVVFSQWQRDLLKNITEEEIRYMHDMRGNVNVS